jgi:diaminohydroxyphosphoribosylaminopyrimidine deaminase/5-amino-6-(5-phosphoribosylamino)uracil reductase
VQAGVLAGEASEVLAPFLTRVGLRRPYIIAKWAQSLDGKLATHTGHSRWLSCEASRHRVHLLRARVDAILVGSGTVTADDPMLTARGVPIRRRALRVVLDGRLAIPETSELVATAGSVPTLVLTGVRPAKTRKAERLRQKGVEVVGCRTRKERVVLDVCLEELMKRDVTNLLVEGGPTVLAALLEARLVDEAFVFTAPILIGGRGAPGVLGDHGAARIEGAIAPRCVQTRRSGSDILLRMRLT